MASSEGHIHWSGTADETVNYLGQELQLTSEISNKLVTKIDPVGTIRIRLSGSVTIGLALPTDGWQNVPDTLPVLQVRVDGHHQVGYIRIRLAV